MTTTVVWRVEGSLSLGCCPCLFAELPPPIQVHCSLVLANWKFDKENTSALNESLKRSCCAFSVLLPLGPGCFRIVQHKRALCPTFGLIQSTYPLIPTEGKKTTTPHPQSEDVSAVKGESLATREPPFNYDTQEIIHRMGPALIRRAGLLDDSSRNLRKLITKVEGRGAGDWASGNLIGLSSPGHN